MKKKNGYDPIKYEERKILVGRILRYLRERENLSLNQICDIIRTNVNYAKCSLKLHIILV